MVAHDSFAKTVPVFGVMRGGQARERFSVVEKVSRSGVIPEPTVTVRMEENERKTAASARSGFSYRAS
ncbi:hypothetical protein AJ88_10490 [Mesorhizobium amorphae CCBAU 01583]|nr:hypothetical protein AJ88_10490 [Mesorhizobium amorphae CCBAU 01583]